nr:hypothetical protein [Tanacetum cinerariifolium]
MSAMVNTTPIMTIVMKTANKKNTPKEADAALKANILDFCEEHYEDILLVIMDKIRHDKRKEVHARLDFGENPRKSQRVREGSQNSSDGTLPASFEVDAAMDLEEKQYMFSAAGEELSATKQKLMMLDSAAEGSLMLLSQVKTVSDKCSC